MAEIVTESAEVDKNSADAVTKSVEVHNFSAEMFTIGGVVSSSFL